MSPDATTSGDLEERVDEGRRQRARSDAAKSQLKDTDAGGKLFRLYLGFLLSILVSAVVYYFVIALPSYNRARLQLERDRQKAASLQRQDEERKAALIEKKAQAKQELQDLLYSSCCDQAESKYWSYVELNGEKVPGKPGVFSAPRWVWEEAEKQKEAALEQCAKRYNH